MGRQRKAIGVWAAVSIGIGSMVGAGIFSIMGIAGRIAGSAVYVSFVIAGIVALLSTYSYARLGVTYLSRGGPVEFLLKGFGDGVLTGGFNILLWVGYVFGLSLYARAFGTYGAALVPSLPAGIGAGGLAVAVLGLFTIVNFIGARAVGRAETIIVATKITFLLGFSVAALFFIQPKLLSVSSWPSWSAILYGAAVVFLAYEGFGLINTAVGDMTDPVHTLPRALYIAVFSVIGIYVLVSVAVLGNLPVPQIVKAQDYALAAAAQPFLGSTGFTLVSIVALFSTASAINATLYGGANVSYTLARDGELPKPFDRKLWRGASEGLFITAGTAAAAAAFLPLSGIALLGSATLLLIYGAVAVAHTRLLSSTKANRWLVWASVVTIAGAVVILVIYMVQTSVVTLALLGGVVVAAFAIEAAYRAITSRSIKSHIFEPGDVPPGSSG